MNRRGFLDAAYIFAASALLIAYCFLAAWALTTDLAVGVTLLVVLAAALFVGMWAAFSSVRR